MRQPLKVKIFMDVSASVVEEQVNAWLAKLEAGTILKTDTVVTTVAKGDGASPFIVVTIWYELPASDQDRPGFRAT
ncbi:hypothetical protein [Bradyrhizobium sp.]|uniref:hypothetical protein n=1 Tax=Bradyrhizobium sp. TaxID=376 RepID=UPI002D3E4776|nr:hypothetical protein [Bradyrhizobium sp.]HZR74653.1 hypothetical protein [Bradyrhizobium sp.]